MNFIDTLMEINKIIKTEKEYPFGYTARGKRAEEILFDYSGVGMEDLAKAMKTPLKIVYRGQAEKIINDSHYIWLDNCNLVSIKDVKGAKYEFKDFNDISGDEIMSLFGE